MQHGFRQSMAWLHGWAGLVVGWVLFTIFVMGTATYYRDDISRWMQPEPIGQATAEQTLERALTRLTQTSPHASRWFIDMPDREDARVRIGSQERKGRFKSERLDPATGEPVQARDTLGGDFFYAFHFQLYYFSPLIGRWIIGVCAMIMFIAMISGVITHRRIFTDFFTFRPRKDQRSWLDFHNASAVLALPFHLMITYTGLVTLMTLYMPMPYQAAYRGDRQAFNREVFDFAPVDKPSGKPATLAPIGPMMTQAERIWGNGTVSRIFVENPGDASALVKMTRDRQSRISRESQTITFDGATGQVRRIAPVPGPATATYGTMYGLHMALFASGPLRVLFFFSGLGGAAMVATGLLLWARKHRQKDEKHAKKAGTHGVRFGTRLVESLNVAAVVGLPLSMVAYLWANRLLPVTLAGRSEWEVRAFFACWALSALHPWLRPARRAWLEQLAVCALAFALLPVVDLATLGYWPRPGFDAVVASLALLPAAAIWHLLRRKASPARKHGPATPRRAPDATLERRPDGSAGATAMRRNDRERV
ncbi:PepSY-associated TM helix domain-containing protein [Chitinasiproducens palmae]|uniref:Uncharacterized iron-regulated membrane protein n=1 Tax=Chitinasiproducens palmae TaxID=1770053 RepID=A0A1H2PIM6_9BURK|nr:PepSY-associated TM helix domain-containing protein [Chitinasiproducens palmae]SDV46101.1 Uncharacterized iron-regulated membrane protein [Chitinasiproducens palmae]